MYEEKSAILVDILRINPTLALSDIKVYLRSSSGAFRFPSLNGKETPPSVTQISSMVSK